jgi:hypothetical protein
MSKRKLPKKPSIKKVEKEKAKAKKKVLKTYTSFVKKQGRHPTTSEMLQLGVTRNTIRHHYGSISVLKELAREEFPKVFRDIIDGDYFTEQRYEKLQNDVKNYSRFVITTAVVGSPVHKKFLAAIENYCSRNRALLLVLPSADPAKSSDWVLDRVLAQKQIHLVFKNLSLNSNFFVSSIKTSAKQLKPMTGLERIGNRNGSFVFASPKQDLDFVATSNTKFPHALMTTGAITLPDYETDEYMSERTAYLAKEDHVMGALIVEIEDDKIYHFRQIQAESTSGNFVDLGDYYKSTGEVEQMDAEALVMGDYHAGETDPTAKQAWKEVVQAVRAKDLVLHDMFNGKSISHHDKKRKVKMAIKFKENHLSLQDEAKITADEANDLASWIKSRDGKLFWVKSNHDDFLARLLEDGGWIDDPINMVLCSSLIEPMSEGKDPLTVLMEKQKNLKADTKSRIVWLKRTQDYKIAGHQIAAHGDLGSHGYRNPTLENLENSYGSSVSGHSHTPAIRRNAWRVGTSSMLKLDYNEGPSAWLHTSCIIYPNGARQLVNAFQGKWRKK